MFYQPEFDYYLIKNQVFKFNPLRRKSTAFEDQAVALGHKGG
jgi:hypothetical protein